MAKNLLQLKESKSQVVLFVPPPGLHPIDYQQRGEVTNLDSIFKFEKQSINAVVKAGFFQRRTFAKIQCQSLLISFNDLKKVIHA